MNVKKTIKRLASVGVVGTTIGEMFELMIRFRINTNSLLGTIGPMMVPIFTVSIIYCIIYVILTDTKETSSSIEDESDDDDEIYIEDQIYSENRNKITKTPSEYSSEYADDIIEQIRRQCDEFNDKM